MQRKHSENWIRPSRIIHPEYPGYWVTLNRERDKIISIHYDIEQARLAAKKKKASFIRPAWGDKEPLDDFHKCRRMKYQKLELWVDIGNHLDFEMPESELFGSLLRRKIELLVELKAVNRKIRNYG
jgi:hypothetical protein